MYVRYVCMLCIFKKIMYFLHKVRMTYVYVRMYICVILFVLCMHVHYVHKYVCTYIHNVYMSCTFCLDLHTFIAEVVQDFELKQFMFLDSTKFELNTYVCT